MRTSSFYSLCAVLFTILVFACDNDAQPLAGEVDDPGDPAEEPVLPPGTGIGAARDISSFDLLAEMGVGWNHGNSFDVRAADKTLWGNPLPSKRVIDEVRRMGFRTLRIPVTWAFHQSEEPPYTIDPDYLARVKEVVDYGFHNRMHVIVNVHHDNDWVLPQAADAEETMDRLSSLWTQVATYFQAYNDSLIFETLNEPRLEGSPEEWSGGTPEGRAYVNEFNRVALDAIRATGGNNALRHIMIPTWAASTVPAAMDDLVIPNDDPKVIISLHTYFPWAFAGEASVPWGSEQDRAALQAELDKVRQKWIVDAERPVILGEWGTIEDNPIASRIEYAEFYAREAFQRGLLTIVWDDGGMFRLMNRHSVSWDYRQIAETIVTATQE